ncbi:peptidylprolyl isomerase [Thermovibrio sp.]
MKRRALTLFTLLSLFYSSPSFASCSPSTAVAEVDGRKITLSYFKFVEGRIPKWVLNKYYGGPKGKRELLEKLVERELILKMEEEKGLFKVPKFKEEVERFKIKTLGYRYLNEKIGEVKVSKRELEEVARRYYKGKASEVELKSLKASLLARKYEERRRELLSKVESEIEVLNPNPKSPETVVARFKGAPIKYKEIKPLIDDGENLKEALRDYALYLLALKEGLNRSEDFKNRLLAYKESVAVNWYKRELISASQVSNSQVKAYYEKHKEEFKVPASARVLVYKFSSLKEAREALKELKEGKRLSGGRVWVVNSNQNNPVAELVFNLKGRYQIVQMPSGEFYLVRVLSRTPSKVMSYGDAYSKIKSLLIKKRMKEKLKRDIEELKERYGAKLENLNCLGN